MTNRRTNTHTHTEVCHYFKFQQIKTDYDQDGTGVVPNTTGEDCNADMCDIIQKQVFLVLQLLGFYLARQLS